MARATLWGLAAVGRNMTDWLRPGECQARWRCACRSLPASKDGGTCDSSHTPATNARRHENRASNSLAKWLQWHRMRYQGLDRYCRAWDSTPGLWYYQLQANGTVLGVVAFHSLAAGVFYRLPQPRSRPAHQPTIVSSGHKLKDVREESAEAEDGAAVDAQPAPAAQQELGFSSGFHEVPKRGE